MTDIKKASFSKLHLLHNIVHQKFNTRPKPFSPPPSRVCAIKTSLKFKHDVPPQSQQPGPDPVQPADETDLDNQLDVNTAGMKSSCTSSRLRLTLELLWTLSVGTEPGCRVTFSPLRSKQSSVKWAEQMEERRRGCQLHRPAALIHWASRRSLFRGNLFHQGNGMFSLVEPQH